MGNRYHMSSICVWNRNAETDVTVRMQFVRNWDARHFCLWCLFFGAEHICFPLQYVVLYTVHLTSHIVQKHTPSDIVVRSAERLSRLENDNQTTNPLSSIHQWSQFGVLQRISPSPYGCFVLVCLCVRVHVYVIELTSWKAMDVCCYVEHWIVAGQIPRDADAICFGGKNPETWDFSQQSAPFTGTVFVCVFDLFNGSVEVNNCMSFSYFICVPWLLLYPESFRNLFIKKRVLRHFRKYLLWYKGFFLLLLQKALD